MKKAFLIIIPTLIGLTLISCTHKQVSEREPTADTARVYMPPKNEIDVRKLWVKIDKDKKDSMIRSNPGHYWAWMKYYPSKELADIVKFEGQITADPHYFNFGDIHSPNNDGLALVDIDDSGRGSLYLDFLRYALFVKAFLNQDYTDQLLEAYIQGLEGKAQKAPKPIQDAVKKNYKKLSQDNADWVSSSLKKDYKLDNKTLEVTGLKSVSPEIAAKAKKLAEDLVAKGKVKEVYDEAYTSTTSGSSKGLDRFWYSVAANDGKIRIIECKEQSFPASGYYTAQFEHMKRVSDAVSVYSDFPIDERYIFDANKTSYWCRPREWNFLKRSHIEDLNKPSKKDEMIEVSTFFANWIKYKASRQASHDYANKLRKDKSKYLDATLNHILKYEKEVFSIK